MELTEGAVVRLVAALDASSPGWARPSLRGLELEELPNDLHDAFLVRRLGHSLSKGQSRGTHHPSSNSAVSNFCTITEAIFFTNELSWREALLYSKHRPAPCSLHQLKAQWAGPIWISLETSGFVHHATSRQVAELNSNLLELKAVVEIEGMDYITLYATPEVFTF